MGALNEGEETAGTGSSPELAAAFKAVLELTALGFHGPAADGNALPGQIAVMDVVLVRDEILGCLFDDLRRMKVFRRGLDHEGLEGFDNTFIFAMAELVQQGVRPAAGFW